MKIEIEIEDGTIRRILEKDLELVKQSIDNLEELIELSSCQEEDLEHERKVAQAIETLLEGWY